MMDAWPGQGSWEMTFGCQDLQSGAEMDKGARTVPHRNAHVVMAVADVCDNQGRHLLLPKESYSYLFETCHTG